MLQLERHWRSTGFLFLATILALWGIPNDRAKATDRLRVAKAQGLAWTFLPLDVGQSEGVFAKYGLDIQIIDLGGDAKVQQAFAANSIDMALASGPGLAFVAKGAPSIGVAAFAGPPRNISVTVANNSKIKSVDDLKGKIVAVSTVGSLSDWLAKRLSSAKGWGPNGIRTVAVGPISSSVSALLLGQVDASLLATEASFQLEEQGKARFLISMDRYAPQFITHVVFAQRNLVRDQPEIVGRFLKAFFASIAIVKKNKPLTSSIAEKVLHQTPAVADRTYNYEVSMLSNDGVFDPQSVDVLRQSFVDMGTLKSAPPQRELLTTRFVPVKP